MIPRRNGRGYECVLVDLNTQHDYCDTGGALPVTNIESLIPALRRAITWAQRNAVPVISSIESHRRFEVGDNGDPPCCIDGTCGQRKMEFTLLRPFMSVEADNTLSCPIDLFNTYQQVIFRKRSEDLLCNPKADRFFTQLVVGEFVLIGIETERAIKSLALGLLAREKPVSVVVDASGYWSKALADLAIKQMAAKGARIITVGDLTSRRLSGRRDPAVPTLPPPPPASGARRNGRNRRNGSAGRNHGL